jgi:hypothetical protein
MPEVNSNSMKLKGSVQDFGEGYFSKDKAI